MHIFPGNLWNFAAKFFMIFLILGLKYFGGLNEISAIISISAKSISTSILKVADKSIEKCRRSRLFGECQVWGKWDFEILSFFGFYPG